MHKRNLNKLFTKTEPETPEAAADPSTAATFETPVPIPGLEDLVKPEPKPAADKPTSKRQKPQSVYLTESELKYIQDIADTYGETRHSVMQYAVKELIRDWKRGKKPRLNNLGKLDK